ncbi:MAG: YceI family protein [Gemmatimonadaceae bacterium]|nr:YceI family protein [Gemmatimonadaceae bacterium]
MATTTQPTGTTTWNIDPAHTTVEFSAKHMMITTVKGRLKDVQGSIQVDEQNPDRSSVEVSFGAGSIDTGVEQRDGHLVSADFLDVANHPRITFKSKRIEGARPEAGKEFTVIGDLTIRGTTREVKLTTTYEGRGRDPWGGERVSFSADGKVDRRDFGLVWNQTLETGGILVSNDIKIHIEAQAVRA